MDKILKKGKLYLIPTPLGDNDPVAVIPQYTLGILNSISCFIAEETKSARRFLKKAGYTAKLTDEIFLVFNEHSDKDRLSEYITLLMKGQDVGLLSEAGMPCIADPGTEIVRAAQEAGIQVIPLPGSSSIFLALSASGMNGQRFQFHGYLPVERQARSHKIRELERCCMEKNQTQIFMETPYRNQSVFDSVLRICQPSTHLAIAMNLTLEHELIRNYTISEWRQQAVTLPKHPAIFLIGTY